MGGGQEGEKALGKCCLPPAPLQRAHAACADSGSAMVSMPLSPSQGGRFASCSRALGRTCQSPRMSVNAPSPQHCEQSVSVVYRAPVWGTLFQQQGQTKGDRILYPRYHSTSGMGGAPEARIQPLKC